ncbi:MAG TPA: 3-oxoacyl-[acyl-carrier-protein] reductase [Dehalococcoidia bacterium]|nr:3-oxoacyl-[acyl-carrier-protein] reductase [Chloroflexota bacterium]MDP5876760.1 3-oxoacyl-[acyl-carrier-protein] reductase [Dehalococcoidia bacterium]MDP6273694.1 3-oxoacyl-[acyl-carrier-protein] reductase [Dehalococcoidia bacterium]MDP7160145.1 3-oxoacyl-[acyl-carrier-protein] reductase [Dehalococcoidia bacterium]MDP7213344.1 3-oxoacyl-[acyl-carrier-protein] reductase [Dehalococcoidia bacterium]
MSEESRSTLITGASRGIGRAIAFRLAAMGHRIAVNYNTHPEDAEEVVESIKSKGGEAIAVQGNVADREQVDAMFSAAEEAFGPVQILVNNAGIIDDALILRMKDEAWDRVIQTNLNGTYYCCHRAVSGMVKARWGRIINISSVVGISGNIGQTNYSASKGAIHSLTYSLAKELSSRNITVNAIAPGYIETATVDDLPQKTKDTIMTWIPMRRFGVPDEVAVAAEFLAKDAARYTTGIILRTDGGMAISGSN